MSNLNTNRINSFLLKKMDNSILKRLKLQYKPGVD